MLLDTCEQTFNCISIDGDTSTNDTVLLLASGQSGVRLKQPSVRKDFSEALLQVCQSLAEQIVSDGEGVKHVIRLFGRAGKKSRGSSGGGPDCGSFFVGKDCMGWCRSRIGGAFLPLSEDPVLPLTQRKSRIEIGDQAVCRGGVGCAFDEKRAHQALSQPRCDIRIFLGRGGRSILFLTTDLTAEYVSINADYST